MGKFGKIAFTIFVVAGLVFAYLGYKGLQESKRPSVKAITLVPDSCEFLLTFDDYTSFSNSLRYKNLLWQDLQKVSYLNTFEKHFHFFDSVLLTNPLLEDLGKNNPVHYALYPGNKFVIVSNVKELADQDAVQSSLEKIKNALAFYAMVPGVQDGVLAISNSEDLLKETFDRKRKKLVANKIFSLLDNTVNYTGASIFINGKVNSIPLQHSYSSISLKPEKIVLNGVKTADTTEFLGDKTAAPITNMDFLERVPLICNAFDVYAVSDAEKVFPTATLNDWWDEAGDAALFNAKKQFYGSISESVARVLMPSKQYAVMLNVPDTSAINEIIPFIKDTLQNGRICRLSDYSGSFVLSTFPKIKLNELHYFVVFDKYMVFTASKSDAEIFLNAYNNHSSVLEDNRFKAFSSRNLETEFHYLSYQLVNSLGKENIPFGNQLSAADISQLKNVGHCSYMAVYKNNFVNYRYNISYLQENFSDEPNVLWTMRTDTSIISTPCIFRNHITQGNEIVFQTKGNILCLLNATGKILWKKPVNEKVESEIFTVDAFKNGKYQLLFNTKNYIHLIDRNGNYVQGYPVKLPAAATNKLCLFDYENTKDPRLFIACADKKIYNYSLWGIKQEGFKPFPTAGEVNLPVKYCRVGASDYLVTADKDGRIYAFSRKGEGRIDFKNKLIENAENFEIIPGNSVSNTHILYYDKQSHLVEKISLEDKKEIYKTAEPEESPAYCFGDFDGNKITDVLLAFENKLEVFDCNGSKNFGKDYTDKLNASSIGFYNTPANKMVYVFDGTNSVSLIHNIDQKTAKEYKSTLPVKVCDLFNDGKGYALVVMNGELKCYRL